MAHRPPAAVTAPAPPAAVTEAERARAVERLALPRAVRHERYHRLVRMAAQALGTRTAMLCVADGDGLWMIAGTGPAALRWRPRAGAPCDEVLRSGTPLALADAAGDPRFAAAVRVTGTDRVAGYAGAPVLDGLGIPVGVLCGLDPEPRQFGPGQLQVLADLAAWAREEMLELGEAMGAAEVQQQLLPESLPAFDGYALAGCCLPSRHVGGDFYDATPVRGGLAFVLADVMGKGVGAALLSATLRATLQAALHAGLRAAPDTAAGDLVDQVMTDAARVVQPDLDRTGRIVTGFLGHLDPVAHRLSWVDAGHGLAVVVDEYGEPTWLRSGTDLPVGVLPGWSWTRQVRRLQPGDRLLVFSDGLLDLLGGTPQHLEHVVGLVREAEHPSGLVEDVRGLTDRHPVVDDVTAVAIWRHE